MVKKDKGGTENRFIRATKVNLQSYNMKKIIGIFIFCLAVYIGYQAYQKSHPNLPKLPEIKLPQGNPTPDSNPEKPSSNRNRPRPNARSSGDELRVTVWNLSNFGRSKNPQELEFIHKRLKSSDLVGILEVSKTFYGTRAVAALDDLLDRTGTNWEYSISEATTGDGAERYAFLWRTDKLWLKNANLSQTLSRSVNREPYVGLFQFKRKLFRYAIFHAVPAEKNPSNENRQMANLIKDAPFPLILGGDFNESASKSFENLKSQGFSPALFRTLTTIKLRKTISGKSLANPYDNIFYDSNQFEIQDAFADDFTSNFPTLTAARRISDHLPVHLSIKFKP